MKSLEIIPKTVGFLNPEGVRDSIPAGGYHILLIYRLLLRKNNCIYTRLFGSSVDIFFGIVISVIPIKVIWQEV